MGGEMKPSTFNFGADLIGLRKHTYLKCGVLNKIMLPVIKKKKISICTGKEEARESKWENKQATGNCCFNWSSSWYCG